MKETHLSIRLQVCTPVEDIPRLKEAVMGNHLPVSIPIILLLIRRLLTLILIVVATGITVPHLQVILTNTAIMVQCLVIILRNLPCIWVNMNLTHQYLSIMHLQITTFQLVIPNEPSTFGSSLERELPTELCAAGLGTSN